MVHLHLQAFPVRLRPNPRLASSRSARIRTRVRLPPPDRRGSANANRPDHRDGDQACLSGGGGSELRCGFAASSLPSAGTTTEFVVTPERLTTSLPRLPASGRTTRQRAARFARIRTRVRLPPPDRRASPNANRPDHRVGDQACAVEAAGVEPASANGFVRASTCVERCGSRCGRPAHNRTSASRLKSHRRWDDATGKPARLIVVYKSRLGRATRETGT